MIYITQGSTHSINIELLLKSMRCFTKEQLKYFHLIGNQDEIQKAAKDSHLDCHVSGKTLYFKSDTISFTPLDNKGQESSSLTALKFATRMLSSQKINTKKNVLLTLPSSKADLIDSKGPNLGHTEFFRNYFNDQSLTMAFQSQSIQIALLTDHIPLKDVTTFPLEIIEKKLHHILALNEFSDYYVSGINPHAGEDGILGSEEASLEKILTRMKKNYTKKTIHGPYPADSIQNRVSKSKRSMIVYYYHDQALGSFKLMNQFLALNITLGLPFLRISVDHGTSEGLYGKNQGDISGLVYSLNKAMDYLNGGHIWAH